MTWKLTVRAGSQVERARAETLDEALGIVRVRLADLAPDARRGPTRAFAREIAPEQQVAARVELSGPGRRRGGVDLRGDGSVAAWTGRVAKRRLADDGDAVAALGDALR